MPPKRNPFLVKSCLIPQRHLVAIVGTLGCITAYTTRVSLNIAITQMVKPWVETDINATHCEEEEGYSLDDDMIAVAYDWDERTQGIILGAFFWGYIVGHIPAGVLSVRLGARHVFGTGVTLSVILTLITPIAITQTEGNWILLSFIRVVQGLGQGVVFPGLTAMLARWTPKSERSIAGTFVYGGCVFGTIISNIVNGHLINYTQSWESVFYLWGGVGVIWSFLWYLFVFSSPQFCPYISDKELEFLTKETGEGVQLKTKVPWGPIFRSSKVWAIILAQVGYDYGFYTMVTDLPKYLNDILRFNIKSNGLWNCVPYLCMWIESIICGAVCDILINRKVCSVTNVRKIFTACATVVPACFLIGAAYSGCNRTLVALMFTAAITAMGSNYCGIKVNILDLSPNFSGILIAISNGCGALMGILAPLMIGFITVNVSIIV